MAARIERMVATWNPIHSEENIIGVRVYADGACLASLDSGIRAFLLPGLKEYRISSLPLASYMAPTGKDWGGKAHLYLYIVNGDVYAIDPHAVNLVSNDKVIRLDEHHLKVFAATEESLLSRVATGFRMAQARHIGEVIREIEDVSDWWVRWGEKESKVEFVPGVRVSTETLLDPANRKDE